MEEMKMQVVNILGIAAQGVVTACVIHSQETFEPISRVLQVQLQTIPAINQSEAISVRITLRPLEVV